jgi:DNA invertase Pin-like site-specific DNA recombinase
MKLANSIMAKAAKRAALYVRVSTDHQTVENQVSELRQVAERRGWQVVEIYKDAGISGAKGRDKRPGLDAMLKDASRRKFDVIMVWAIDRLGRSLIDLLGTIQHLEVCGVDLYLEQQHLDTTTPTGKLLFQITGAFAEATLRAITSWSRYAELFAYDDKTGRFTLDNPA